MEAKQKLAYKIVNVSLKVKKKQKVLVEFSDCDDDFLLLLQEEIFKAGAYPFFKNINRLVHKNNLLYGDKDFYLNLVKHDEVFYDNMDYIVIVAGANNIYEYSGVNKDKKKLFNEVYSKRILFEIRLKKRWILLRYPTASFAQLSGMGTLEFKEHFFKVCNLDYEKMDEALVPLKDLLEKSDKVKIISPNTNLEFSIKNMPAIICTGQCNLPDGEIYTAPIKNSVNGEITFNITAARGGIMFENIWLKFNEGKVVDFNCNNNEEFKKLLDLDEGSRYLGEFAFGVNPHVKNSIKDILFDEKMSGSIHLALGNAYEDCFNGNSSVLHFDLILNQTLVFGGGEVWLDNVKIRENGLFILPELVGLNPENLL